MRISTRYRQLISEHQYYFGAHVPTSLVRILVVSLKSSYRTNLRPHVTTLPTESSFENVDKNYVLSYQIVRGIGPAVQTPQLCQG